MRKSEIAVGLDIGTTKIVAMVGRKNENGKVEILGVGRAKSLGVKGGVVNNITKTENSIREAIRDAEEMSKHKITEVTVGIAGQHIRSLQHNDYITRKDPERVIDENDIKALIDQVHKLVMLPGEEIIHVLPQEFKVDSNGDIADPIGMYGSRLEANFHVVVGQITSIKNVVRCVKNVGLSLAGINLEPIASAEATLSDEEREAGVALIDIGGGTTDIAIFKDNMIRHTSVIPFGGNVITEDIKEGCSIIERYAEQLKEKFGSAWPGENKENEIVSIPGLNGREAKEISLKTLSQIIKARVQEILIQCNMELKNYGCDDAKKKLIAGIVLTGGGSNLKHIRQLAEYITSMDVRIGQSNANVVGDLAQQYAGPEYATSIGLLMRALSCMEDHLEEEPMEVPETTAVVEMNQEPEVDPILGGVKEKPKAGLKMKKKPASNFFAKWTEKFIQIINDTE